MPLWMLQPIGSIVRWRYLRHATALGIGFSYSLAYLLVSRCLATGVFHIPANTSQASHHRASAHAHDHHDDTSSDTSLADICDFALQVLMTSAWQPAHETVADWVPGESILGLDEDECRSQIPANLNIRSPPFGTAA